MRLEGIKIQILWWDYIELWHLECSIIVDDNKARSFDAWWCFRELPRSLFLSDHLYEIVSYAFISNWTSTLELLDHFFHSRWIWDPISTENGKNFTNRSNQRVKILIVMINDKDEWLYYVAFNAYIWVLLICHNHRPIESCQL